MKTYYQVCAGFTLQKGRPQLVRLSLHSTTEYFPFLFSFEKKPIFSSHFFYSVSEAENYIDYLFSRHPASTAPRPVLDAHQFLLF